MNKICVTSILLFAGCVSSREETITSEQHDPRYEVRVGFSDFPNYLSCIFTSSSLGESKKFLNEHKATHRDMVIYDLKTGNVIEVDYRYEVRIGFSDYTYSNGTWKDTIFTSSSLKESEKYLNEHKTPMQILVIYDLKTGESIK